MKNILQYELSLPEYQVDTQPDSVNIGSRIDTLIKQHFLGQSFVIRCLSSADHSGKTVDGVIEIIKQTGTDRYDPARAGDRYDNVENKQIDFFALPFTVTPSATIMEQFIESFYTFSIQFTGQPVRVDIVILYDPTQVEKVIHTYSDGRTKDDGYIFKYPERKSESVQGIIKIL